MNRKQWTVWVLVVVALIAIDQATKYWVVQALTHGLDGLPNPGERIARFLHDRPERLANGLFYAPKQSIEVVDGFFRLRYAENQGAAFGMFRSMGEPWRGLFFHAISLAAIVFIVRLAMKLNGERGERFLRWGLALVFSGALGNYIDRWARGFVIDFLEAHVNDRATWPNFNVADSAICVGIGLILIDSWVRREHAPSKPARATKTRTASAEKELT